MKSTLIDHITNPVRSKIFMEILSGEGMTAKKLLQKFADVTQPTMYRHLRAMLTDGVIIVTGEVQKRGTVEKTYAVNEDIGIDIERVVTENDGHGYLQLFLQYMTGLLAEFKHYAEADGIDIVGDGSAFTIAPFYATAEELLEAFVKMGEILMPLYTNEPTEGRMLRNFCIVVTPPKTN